MNKKYLIFAAVSALIFGAWSTTRPNHNRPVSFKLSPGGTSIIPMMFKAVDGIHLSNVFTDLNDKGYSHIKVINDANTGVELVTSEFATPPSSDSSERLYAPATITGSSLANSSQWDDISVFQYLYIQSSGSSLSSGTVKVMVW
jgi:hypothetical protein